MEQDGFELRLRLSKFLSGAASNEQNCRGAVALCLKNAELAEELVECFIESLREVWPFPRDDDDDHLFYRK